MPCPGMDQGILLWPEGRTEPSSLIPWGFTSVLCFCPWGSPVLAGSTRLQDQANARVPGAPGS